MREMERRAATGWRATPVTGSVAQEATAHVDGGERNDERAGGARRSAGVRHRGEYGLGRATAHVLARAGASVALVARGASDLAGVADELRGDGHSALALTCDLADAGGLAQSRAESEERARTRPRARQRGRHGRAGAGVGVERRRVGP